MERHKCKLHLLNFSIPPNLKEEQEIELGSYSSSSDKEEENLKPSSKIVDPEFASVVMQDRESETESSKNTTRRRSKRTRKMSHQFQDNFSRTTESWEQPASSVSDTTTEEDVAFCLMMLKRDNRWKQTNNKKPREVKRFEEFQEQETDESEEEMKCSKTRSKGRYKCETCNKVFNSYQALGGHRASHKKIKLYNPKHGFQPENTVTSCSVAGKKVHECPYCFRVFSSGQALGGHKRSHLTGSASHTVRISKFFEGNSSLIDLNLPAPIDEDDASQIEVSAVSDAEFVDHIKEVSHSKNKV